MDPPSLSERLRINDFDSLVWYSYIKHNNLQCVLPSVSSVEDLLVSSVVWSVSWVSASEGDVIGDRVATVSETAVDWTVVANVAFREQRYAPEIL